MVDVNIDGDWALFRGCFACEKSIYTLVVPGLLPIIFESKRDLNTHIKENKIEEYEIIKESDLKPVEYALGTIKSMLELVVDKLNPRSVNVYLTGPDNFRYKVARTHPYKGNREKTQRPHWQDEATDYLVRRWDAKVITGMEADDALGINQTDTSVLVSPDKDLDQVPGWHYNPVKEEKYHVDDIQAATNFWRQMLTGDATDNIHGLDGIGPTRAGNLLAGLRTESSMRQRVWDMYMEAFDEQASERFNENYALLRILRSPDELARIRND